MEHLNKNCFNSVQPLKKYDRSEFAQENIKQVLCNKYAIVPIQIIIVSCDFLFFLNPKKMLYRNQNDFISICRYKKETYGHGNKKHEYILGLDPWLLLRNVN